MQNLELQQMLDHALTRCFPWQPKKEPDPIDPIDATAVYQQAINMFPFPRITAKT